MLENENKKSENINEKEEIIIEDTKEVLQKEENNTPVEEEKKVIDEENKIETTKKTTKEDITKKTSFQEEKISVLNSLNAVIIDQAIIGGASFAGLYIFDGLLRLSAGHFVSDKVGMYLTIYAIFNVLYPIIMESSKLKNTLGRKLSNIKSIKIK